MGLAAVAVFAAPLLVTQVALRRYAGIRATYLQTVRALARVTEIGGYVETGHSARVSQPGGGHRAGARHAGGGAARARVRGADARHRPAVAARPGARRRDRPRRPRGAAAHRRVRRRGDPAGAGARLGGRHRPAAVRPVPPRRPVPAAAAVQPDHPRRQRLRRPGGQLAPTPPGRPRRWSGCAWTPPPSTTRRSSTRSAWYAQLVSRASSSAGPDGVGRGAHTPVVVRGYSACTSVITLIRYGADESKARRSAAGDLARAW